MLNWLASPRWMLAFFIFAFAGALTALWQPDWITPVWALPLGVFAISLLAAVATNPRFRRDIPLLGLHLGLLAFVVLVAFARLTYLDGGVTLTRGEQFSGSLHIDRRGPLHFGAIENLRFANVGFTEAFDDKARWEHTSARVRWWGERGASHVAVIGDDRPLLLQGYRIYTTGNRGYAPIFRWQPAGGGEQLGSVQLRYGAFNMANSWQLPGGPEIWAMLDVPAGVELQRGQRRHNLGEAELPHRLVVRLGKRREVLLPGQALQLPQGRLTYLALDSWMGYRVVYDVSMHWMAAAAVVVVACMMVFYARLISRAN